MTTSSSGSPLHHGGIATAHTAAAAAGAPSIIGSPLFAASLSPPRPRARAAAAIPRRELTDAERAEIEHAFDRLSESNAAATGRGGGYDGDDGGSGGGDARLVTPRQLKVALRALGFPARKAEVRGMLRDAGLDAAAPLGAAAFREVVRGALLSRPRGEELARAFALFDVDGSGKIGADALRAVARRLGLDAVVTPAEVAAMVAEFDADGDGAIDAAEFAAIMAEAAGDDDGGYGGGGGCGGYGGAGAGARSSVAGGGIDVWWPRH